MEDFEEKPVGVDVPLAEFGADLTREEYIAYATPKFRPIPPALLSVGCIAISLYYGFVYGFDLADYLMILLGVATGLCWLVILPAMARRAQGRGYDHTRLTYDFCGTVRVYSDRIEKECGGEINRLYYDSAAYIEDETYISFVPARPKPNDRALVLPARALTERDADLLRDRAMTCILPERRQLRHRMTAKAAERLFFPALPEPEEEILCRVVTEFSEKGFLKEIGRVADTALGARAVTLLPAAILSALIAVLYQSAVLGGIVFAVTAAATWLLPRMRMRSNAKRAMMMDEVGRLREVKLILTDRGVRYAVGETEKSTLMPWETVGHAVESPTMLEFISRDRVANFRVPKEKLTEQQLETIRRTVNDRLPHAR